MYLPFISQVLWPGLLGNSIATCGEVGAAPRTFLEVRLPSDKQYTLRFEVYEASQKALRVRSATWGFLEPAPGCTEAPIALDFAAKAAFGKIGAEAASQVRAGRISTTQ